MTKGRFILSCGPIVANKNSSSRQVFHGGPLISHRKTASEMSQVEYKSFKEFYPFYLSQHKNLTCRRLHIVGTLSGATCLVNAIRLGDPTLVLMGLVVAYGMAWIGHFFFEKNVPATFKYPRWSFMGDWVMMKDVFTGKLPL